MIFFSNLTSRSFLLIAGLIAFLWAARGYPKWRKVRKDRLSSNTTPNKTITTPTGGDDSNSLSSLLNPRSIPVLPLAAVYIILRATWDLFCLTVYYTLLGCERLAGRLDTALFHFVTVQLPLILYHIGHWWTHTGVLVCRKGWNYTTTTLLPSLVKSIDTLAWQLSISWTAITNFISVANVHIQAAFTTMKHIAAACFHTIEGPVVWIAWRASRLAILVSNGVVRISKTVWQDVCAVWQVVAKVMQAFWNTIGYPVTVFIVDKTEILYRVVSNISIKVWNIVFTRLVLPLYKVIRPVADLMLSKILEVLLSERVKRALKLCWKWMVSTLSLLTRDIGVFLQSAFKVIEWSIIKLVLPLYRTLRCQLLPNLSALYTRLRTSFWYILEPILTAMAPLISPVVRACSALYDNVIYPALCNSYNAMVSLSAWIINKIQLQHNLYRLCQALYAKLYVAAGMIYDQGVHAYTILAAFFWHHAPAISQLLAKITEQVGTVCTAMWTEAQIIGAHISTSISIQAEAVAQSLERVVGNWIDDQTDDASKLKTQ